MHLVSQAGREPLAALQRQQVGVPQHAVAPAAATRVRKSMSSQLEQQSTAAQLTRRPKLAAMPDSPVPDIDSVDAADPLTAASYVSDIYAYHRRTEANFRPLPTYMARQVGLAAGGSAGAMVCDSPVAMWLHHGVGFKPFACCCNRPTSTTRCGPS